MSAEEIVCIACGLYENSRRHGLPNGWKRKDGQLRCGDCWREGYVLRAITFPVVSPVGMAWEELDKKLTPIFGQVTQAMNWTVSRLFSMDGGSVLNLCG